MNKIYKLVFNRRIGAFVAVSEAAKSVTKGAVVVGTVSLGCCYFRTVRSYGGLMVK